MIVIDNTKCIQCGSCLKICHEHCIALSDETISINYELCSTCTQCIAICPQQAISWDKMPPVTYDTTRLPTPEHLDELFKERRTTRFFTKEKIDRTLLGEIVSYGVYAPTNNYNLRVIVVDDEELIKELDHIVLRFAIWIYRLFYKPKIVFTLLKGFMSACDAHGKVKVKLESSIARGHAFHDPAAIVLIVGDTRVALSAESAHYALYNMLLYAQGKGLGNCLWGNGTIFLDRSRTARKRLGLNGHEHILGAAGLGYPAVIFRNKVTGKAIQIQWNDG